MTYLLFGLLIAAALYVLGGFLVRAFAAADPAKLARGLRAFGIVSAGLAALALILTGRGGLVAALAPMIARFLGRSGGGPRPQENSGGSSSGGPSSGGTSSANDARRNAERNGMSREEALAALGLAPGAGPAEIRAAHKRLMMDRHPDRGGSDAAAARLNQARDVLLG